MTIACRNNKRKKMLLQVHWQQYWLVLPISWLLAVSMVQSFRPSQHHITTIHHRPCLQNHPLATLSSEQSTTDPTVPTGISKKTKTRFITCSSTKELVHAIQEIVQPDDCVAELGAQLRDVSMALCKQVGPGGKAVLVDVKRKFPKSISSSSSLKTTASPQEETRTRAMRRPGDEADFAQHPCVFVEMDSLEDWRRVFLNAAPSYNVFVLDVNAIVGNDLEWTALAIMREFVALFGGDINGSDVSCTCKTVLVKSESLNQWATRIVHGQHWIEGLVDGPTQQGTLAKSPKTICTVGVEQYRQTIARAVQPGDAVLEVGCHLGTSTTLLHEVASSDDRGYAIGVDVGSKIIRGAQERYPNVFFSVGDAWKTADLLRIQQRFLEEQASPKTNGRIGFDVVYVDVGGLSGSDGLLEALSLLSALMNALDPRCVVIKSLCMLRLSSLLIPYWRAQRRKQS